MMQPGGLCLQGQSLSAICCSFRAAFMHQMPSHCLGVQGNWILSEDRGSGALELDAEILMVPTGRAPAPMSRR
eukprot:s5181_g6.t1